MLIDPAQLDLIKRWIALYGRLMSAPLRREIDVGVT
jgi:hypothetical protein